MRLKRLFSASRLQLYAFSLPQDIPLIKPKIEVQIYQLRNISESACFNLFEIANELICQSRFAQGEVVWIAAHQSHIAAYCWVALSETEVGEIDKVIKVKNEELYIYDALTLPDYRGNNLYPYILTYICQYGKEKGYTRALIFVTRENIPSQLGIEKAGFKRFQVIKYIRIFGISFYRYSPIEEEQERVIFLPRR
jgi:GNAT superfamily N-acetyltransferase